MMENIKHEIIKTTDFWKEEIQKAGLLENLKFFNDVVTEKRPPHEEGGWGDPVLKDVILDGKKCDVYHSDHKGGPTLSRIFIHIKE